MKISWIFYCFFNLVVSANAAKSTKWVNKLVRYIVKDSGVRQVILTTSFGKPESTLNPQIDEMFLKLMRNIPTVISNTEDLVGTRNSSFNDAKMDNPMMDTSTKLFLIVEESRDLLNVLPSRSTINALLAISERKPSKFLLVLISQQPRDNFEDLLEYTWKKRLLDFTIIELTEMRVTRNLTDSHYSLSVPIIHRYNPFKKEYTRNKWTTMIKWFPKKGENMWGYGLNIAAFDSPPFSIVKFDNVRSKPIKLGGANIELVRTTAERLNFTTNWLRLEKFMALQRNPTAIGMHDLMTSGKVDLLMYTAPHYTQSLKYTNVRTTPIIIDRLCPLVPILPSANVLLSMNFFEAYITCLVLVIIFWILGILFKFNPRVWQSFNVIRVIFGVSVTRQPTKKIERTMFACLLVVSFIYSSNIYTALTHISLDTEASEEINSFEDLDNSGLTPIINSFVYNKTFDRTEGPLINIKRKTLIGYNIVDCLSKAARYKNVTCLSSEMQMVAIARYEKLEEKIKIVEPCFWSDSMSFLLGKRSPYQSYINDVIGRLHDTGLIGKWYKEPGSGMRENKDDNDDDDEYKISGTQKNTKALRYQLLAIAIIGYVSSTLAFLGEIVLHRIIKRGRPKYNDCWKIWKKNRPRTPMDRT